uniref:Uncharacterized protein n=1 Tax=Avena sativa TaxID=4498 RepID=A0ACD5VPZ8_AVESA
MACPCWRWVMSFVRLETEETASLRRRLHEAEAAAADGEAIRVLGKRVASLQRSLRSAVLDRNAAVARMHGAERRAEETEDAVEDAARAGELAAAEVIEKMMESSERDARIRELEREMQVLRDHEQYWALEAALDAAARSGEDAATESQGSGVRARELHNGTLRDDRQWASSRMPLRQRHTRVLQ